MSPSTITIGRYGAAEAKFENGAGFSAWIAGEDDLGRGWAMWLDDTGRPVVFFAKDADGALVEPRIHLVDPPSPLVSPDEPTL